MSVNNTDKSFILQSWQKKKTAVINVSETEEPYQSSELGKAVVSR